MKLANVAHRLSLVVENGVIDVETLTGGLFGSYPQAVFPRWDEFTAWINNHTDQVATAEVHPFTADELGAPVPEPRQIFGIGLNYGGHAEEAGIPLPEGNPVVFAKFPTSITGPSASVELPSDAVDFEAELVVVIGRRAHRISRAEAWSYVAGLTLGQDLSERLVQFRGPSPQFTLGKSYPGFSPIGPLLVSAEEFPDRDDIGIGCRLNGEQMQEGRTDDLVFSVPELIESLSAVVPLLPGDLIFTGTPAGIGWTREPRVVLRPGDLLTTHAEGIGEIRTTFTPAT